MKTAYAKSGIGQGAADDRFRGIFRICDHARTGRIKAPKICIRNYECYHCPFDQLLDAMDQYLHN